MTSNMAARWIQRLDQYSLVIEHRRREKHQNADGLTKKTEYYEEKEKQAEGAPQHISGFALFEDPTQFEQLPNLDDEQMVAHVHSVDMQASQLNWMETVASPIQLKTWFLIAPVELNTLDDSELSVSCVSWSETMQCTSIASATW